MSNATNSGKELQNQDLSLSDPASTSSPNLRDWVKMEVQLLRECIPGPLLSVEAMQITQNMMVAIAEEIGTEKFHVTILKAIETCDRRPTVAKIRQLAGLNSRLEPDAEAVAVAWSFIVGIVKRHIGRDGNGNAVLQPWVSYRSPGLGGICVQEDVPDVPIGIHEAVSAMGGWGTLADNLPQWTSQKFNQFKELYRPTAFERDQLLSISTSTAIMKKSA
jgi:hypothetical protein